MVQFSLPRACKLDPSKIHTLQDLPTSDSQAKLQFFLGLISYFQPFMPSLSAKTTFLHVNSLLSGTWNSSTEAAFQCLKACICQTLLNTTLAYYDWSKPVVVQTDAIEYGLGATLIQTRHPIAFASKMFTDVETHYCKHWESVLQYALVWRSSIPTYMAGMSL